MAGKEKIDNIKKKASEVAKKTVTKVATNPMTVVYGIAGVIAIVGIYSLVKGAKNLGDQLTGDGIDNKVEIGRLRIDRSRLSITPEQARIFASQLLTAFNWTWPFPKIQGTDNDVVEGIFDRIGPEDFKLIFLEFGDKDYNGFGSPPNNIGGGFQSVTGISSKRNLVYWLREEFKLSTPLRDKIKETVERAGFAF